MSSATGHLKLSSQGEAASQEARGKESACHCQGHRRGGFHPRVGKIPWRGKWQPSPVFLPGGSHGQRSLARLQSLGSESDTTWQLRTHTQSEESEGKGVKAEESPCERWGAITETASTLLEPREKRGRSRRKGCLQTENFPDLSRDLARQGHGAHRCPRILTPNIV